MGGLWDRSRFANGVSETGARVQTRRCSCVNAGLFAFSQTKRGSVWVALIARARVQACSANNARRRTGRAGVGSELLRARRMLGGRDGPAGASLSRSPVLDVHVEVRAASLVPSWPERGQAQWRHFVSETHCWNALVRRGWPSTDGRLCAIRGDSGRMGETLLGVFGYA